MVSKSVQDILNGLPDFPGDATAKGKGRNASMSVALKTVLEAQQKAIEELATTSDLEPALDNILKAQQEFARILQRMELTLERAESALSCIERRHEQTGKEIERHYEQTSKELTSLRAFVEAEAKKKHVKTTNVHREGARITKIVTVES